MDASLAARLRSDKDFSRELTKTVKDYATLGFGAVNYWTGEFDVAHDMLHAFKGASKADFDKMERGHPRNFVLPVTATQISTMTTYITQMLYGSDSPHKVEGRGAEDQVRAEFLNALLKWNTEQQPTYALGYLWVQDCLTFNRGIMYNSWKPIFRPEPELVDFVDETGALVAEVDEAGNPMVDPVTNEVMTKKVARMTNKRVGGYCAMELVSPYDFCADPSLPIIRMQEGRFCGHKFKVPWTELKRRSKLPVDDPSYVMPEAVDKIRQKRQRGADMVPSLSGNGGIGNVRPDTMMSRSAFERQRSSSPLATDAANTKDNGIVDGFELWVRLSGKDFELNESEEPIVWQFILANDVILAVNESTYKHGMFPYSVAEGRPNAHYQFSPSWTMLLYGVQQHIDYLKDRHSEALQRTVGNVFVIDPMCIDAKDFLDPDKEGLLISRTEAGAGRPINEIFQQVPIKDLTEKFTEEAQSFITYADTVTGANSSMQGGNSGADSATEFASTQQMAAGRLSNVARLLSVQGLVPQTRQFVANFQQFLEMDQVVRYLPDPLSSPLALQNQSRLSVSADVIQGEFDIVAHDGTMPGTDGRKVAAITKLLEASAMFPQVFSPAPGNIDPKKLIMAAAKSSGLDVERFQYDEAAIQAAGPAMAAMNGFQATPIPGAAPRQNPGPAPAVPSISAPTPPTLAPNGPTEPRPGAMI